MNVVGLDLGIRNFKAIEIKKEKGMAELVRYGISETIPANLLSETKEELEKYSKELLLFFNESGFSTPNVIVALPETSVFTRIITVPKMSEKGKD